MVFELISLGSYRVCARVIVDNIAPLATTVIILMMSPLFQSSNVTAITAGAAAANTAIYPRNAKAAVNTSAAITASL